LDSKGLSSQQLRRHQPCFPGITVIYRTFGALETVQNDAIREIRAWSGDEKGESNAKSTASKIFIIAGPGTWT
jgi:hypothetical protein